MEILTRPIIGIILLAWFLTVGSAEVTPEKANAEMRLIRDIFQGYNNISRPKLNSSEPVEVKVSLILMMLGDLVWIDEYLHWNPADYENLTKVIVPQNKVWLPDAAIENSAGEIYGEVYDSKIRIRIDSNGQISYFPSGQVETSCNVNLRYFPFDIQKCYITFSNWIYTGSEVILTNSTDTIDISQFKKNGQWEVVATQMSADGSSMDGVLYPRATGTIILKRKPLFYLIYVGLPCILLSGLSLLVFWIPPDAGERISLGITVLLSFSVFQLLLLEKMPESSDYLPILGIYLMLVMMNTSLSLVLSIVVLNVYFSADKQSPAPQWAKSFILGWVAPFLGMRQTNEQKKIKRRSKMSLSMINSFSRSASILGADTKGQSLSTGSTDANNSIANDTNESMSENLNGMGNKTDCRVSEEWKFMAKVLDRFFFTLVATMDLLMTICCMVIVPLLNSSVEEAKQN